MRYNMLPMNSACKAKLAEAAFHYDSESSIPMIQINKDKDKSKYIDLLVQARQGKMTIGTDNIWYLSRSFPELGYTLIIWYDYAHDKDNLYIRGEKDPTPEELDDVKS